ncbi:MAG: DUF5130 domain-containing protein [Sporichthyaceae bacterium]|nr:DUF5130 domain-containing protein [Sporichthyaceae bacterium]
MPAGEAFSPGQQEQINRAIEIAERESGLHFSVYVGAVGGDSRAAARGLHREIPDRARAVLVYVDPAHRALEIVTGTQARRALDDRACSLAALAMTSTFAAGDLTGGIVDGLRVLGEYAHQPRILHRDHRD